MLYLKKTVGGTPMKDERNARKLSPWEQGFCWYWHNEEEIFSYTEEDFERDAAARAYATQRRRSTGRGTSP